MDEETREFFGRIIRLGLTDEDDVLLWFLVLETVISDVRLLQNDARVKMPLYLEVGAKSALVRTGTALINSLGSRVAVSLIHPVMGAATVWVPLAGLNMIRLCFSGGGPKRINGSLFCRYTRPKEN